LLYATEEATISGIATKRGIILAYDLNLKKGWNVVIWGNGTSSGYEVFAGPIEDHFRWRVYN
jgi:hypothetical protein